MRSTGPWRVGRPTAPGDSRQPMSLRLFLLILAPVFLWSLIAPRNYGLWLAESLPVILGTAALVRTHKTFPLSRFALISILIGCYLVLIGAHYSYSRVPLFDTLKQLLDLSRNNYDKLGHFFQGFIPAVVLREYLIRNAVVRGGFWTDSFAFVFAVSLSAVYEVIEWFSAMISAFFGSTKKAAEFLGAQNYFWDSQSDIFFAILGAATAILLFGRYHSGQIRQLRSRSGAGLPAVADDLVQQRDQMAQEIPAVRGGAIEDPRGHVQFVDPVQEGAEQRMGGGDDGQIGGPAEQMAKGEGEGERQGHQRDIGQVGQGKQQGENGQQGKPPQGPRSGSHDLAEAQEDK